MDAGKGIPGRVDQVNEGGGLSVRWHLGAPGPRWGQGHESCWELQMEELCAKPWAEHRQGFSLTL